MRTTLRPRAGCGSRPGRSAARTARPAAPAPWSAAPCAGSARCHQPRRGSASTASSSDSQY